MHNNKSLDKNTTYEESHLKQFLIFMPAHAPYNLRLLVALILLELDYCEARNGFINIFLNPRFRYDCKLQFSIHYIKT